MDKYPKPPFRIVRVASHPPERVWNTATWNLLKGRLAIVRGAPEHLHVEQMPATHCTVFGVLQFKSDWLLTHGEFNDYNGPAHVVAAATTEDGSPSPFLPLAMPFATAQEAMEALVKFREDWFTAGLGIASLTDNWNAP